MTPRIKTILDNIISAIDASKPGNERPALLQVKARINSILEEAGASDSSVAALESKHKKTIAKLKSEHKKTVAELSQQNAELVKTQSDFQKEHTKIQKAHAHLTALYLEIKEPANRPPLKVKFAGSDY